MPTDHPEDPPPREPRADDTTTDLRAAPDQDAARIRGARAGASFRGGEIFGPYRIERLLGRGGMGEVYEAEQLETGHRVALKLLSAELLRSDTERRRFLREGRLAAAVRHPHSLYVYGTEEIDGCPVIAMELARRGTLRDMVESTGLLTSTQVARFGIQLAQGLAAASEAGVLHRDIKPANCFLESDSRVKIGDYGLSLPSNPQVEGDLTMSGDFLGTPAFASPEQVRGEKLDLRSDLYSLGATLYYLATGRPPFAAGRGAKLLADVLTARPESTRSIRPEIPRGLDRIILRCLEKDPAKRYATYAELEEALSEVAIAPIAPPTLWPRVAAGLIDGAIISLVFLLASERTLSLPVSPGWYVGQSVQGFFISYAYGALFEATWGRTPGKALLGLRVVTASSEASRVLSMLLRNLVFVGGDLLAVLVLIVLTRSSGIVKPGENPVLDVSQTIVPMLWLLALFSRARAANGFNAWHDLWSGTRVVQARQPEHDGRVILTAESERSFEGQSKLGPYLIVEPLTPGATDVIEGFDPALRRRVWIVPSATQAPHLSLSRRDLDDVARPRWVHGSRGAEAAWDAYELEPGEPFLRATSSPRGWKEVRLWLLDLAQSANRVVDDPSLRTSIDFNRLWVTRKGRLLLLDFVPPGAPAETAQVVDTSVSSFARSLSELARQAMGMTSRGESREVLPLHASRLLERLHDGLFASTQEMEDALRAVSGRPVAPSRALRVAQVGIGLCFPIVFGAVFTFAEWEAERRYPDLMAVDRALVLHQKLEAATPSKEVANDLRMIELYLAGPLRVASADTTVLGLRVSADDRSDRAQLESILRRHRAVPADSLPIVTQAYESIARRRSPLSSRVELLTPLQHGLAMMGFLCCVLAILGLPLAMVFRGGAAIRLLGQAIVDRRGRAISQNRAALRWLIGSTPFAVIWWLGVVRANGGKGLGSSDGLFASGWLALGGILCLVAIVWSAVDRHRIFQDHVCGTRVTLE